MTNLFRSETMTYVQMVLNEESATEIIRTLGEFKKLHIEDHGKPDRRLYKETKRKLLDCVAWERRLMNIRSIMQQNNVVPPGPEVKVADAPRPRGNFMDAIQRAFGPIEQELTIQLKFKIEETIALNAQIEHQYVLQHVMGDFFDKDDSKFEEKSAYGSVGERLSNSERKIGLLEETIQVKRFSNTITGTIATENRSLFERFVYRISKGPSNAFCIFSPIDGGLKDSKGNIVNKSIFSITIVGNELPRRIRKICSLFAATIYDVPNSHQEIEKMLKATIERKNESIKVLKQTSLRINRCLSSLARNQNGDSPLKLWEKYVHEEIRICEMMQRFYALEDNASTDNIGRRIAAKGWVPAESLSQLNDILKKPGVMCTPLYEEQEHIMPPTYWKTNKFTSIYQGIVDTYGVANYKEANPGLFTIISFPFLFAVMYGDIFHGSFLTIMAIYVIWNENKLLEEKKMGKQSEMFSYIFEGRYMLILMGPFAIFCGSIYNDCASVPLALYESSYDYPTEHNATELIYKGTPYPWGIDPAWYHKGNSLAFQNSLKMKLAVTLGVIQMCVGIFLSLSNHLYFRDNLSVVFEFIPRILFMLCTFGYMVFMIIFKLCKDWSDIPHLAPNIIQTMIKMFLSPTAVPDPPLYDASTQHGVQVFCLAVAVLCIPVMLFPKSIIKYYQWKAKYNSAPSYDAYHDEDEKNDFLSLEVEDSSHNAKGGHGHGHVGPDFSFSDDLINTSIHTIEFILGAVSNTASYLRLWALSLAHAQLAEVFWNKWLFEYGLRFGLGAVTGFIGFAVWAATTAGVLLTMDVLECFLHALRLHWVEFQNKFYGGEGYKFIPFTFEEEDE